jgi:alkylhydroperoxidase family enzyme
MEVDNDKEKAILEHAWKCSVDPTSLTDEDFVKLKKVGLSDEEIVEVQEMISVSLETIVMRNIFAGSSSDKT